MIASERWRASALMLLVVHGSIGAQQPRVPLYDDLGSHTVAISTTVLWKSSLPALP